MFGTSAGEGVGVRADTCIVAPSAMFTPTPRAYASDFVGKYAESRLTMLALKKKNDVNFSTPAWTRTLGPSAPGVDTELGALGAAVAVRQSPNEASAATSDVGTERPMARMRGAGSAARSSGSGGRVKTVPAADEVQREALEALDGRCGVQVLDLDGVLEHRDVPHGDGAVLAVPYHRDTRVWRLVREDDLHALVVYDTRLLAE